MKIDDCFVFSRIFQDRESLIEGALDLASHIAKMSPIAVSGTKHNLNYSRDHPVDESLKYIVSFESLQLKFSTALIKRNHLLKPKYPGFP